MCSCINIEVGSYDNQTELIPPPHMTVYKSRQGGAPTICIDKCLEDEIKGLWELGITTTGCCCGHNKVPAFIGVIDDDIQRMKEFGYKRQHNPCRPDDNDSFVPHSI